MCINNNHRSKKEKELIAICPPRKPEVNRKDTKLLE